MVLPFGLEHEAQRAHPGRSTIASAPPAEPNFEIKYGTYIEFIVVNGEDRYVIRTDRKAVLESSVELAKIIQAGPTSGRKNDLHFLIHNVDKDDFELLIRFLETKFIKYRDHKHILKILELADRFNCPDLVIQCVKELDLHLTSATVLDVFHNLWYYNCISPIPQLAPVTSQLETAKKKQKKPSDKSSQTPFTPEEYTAALLSNSLQLIDMHAELILTKEEMSALRFEELEMIAKRPALQLLSELVLYDCLADWSSEECKRKKLDLTAENRRRVLGALCYYPRYLNMTSKEFRKACDRVELLDEAEISLVKDAIAGKKSTNLTTEQNNLLEKFRTPRPEFPKLPIHLSDRSHPQNYAKKMRKEAERAKKAADAAANGEVQTESCWNSCGMNCLRVFVCIFD